MSDPMQDIRNSFFVECEELIEALFDALQDVADGGADTEVINVAFRAVHSIKGGAGAFALDELVGFAHHFETVMDLVRSGALAADESLSALFFRCGDVLSDLVRMSRDGEPIDPAAYADVEAALIAASGGDDAAPEAPAPEFVPATLDLGDLDLDVSGAEPDDDFDAFLADLDNAQKASGLICSFVPEQELYDSGNEPLYLLRTLADLGSCRTQLAFTPTDAFDGIPPAKSLSWRIEIDTAAQRAEVQEIFEFVEGLCHLTVDGRDVSLPGPEVSSSPADTAPAVSPDEPTLPAAAVTGPTDAETHAPATDPSTAQRAPAGQTVRVDLERIDRLVNLVGELVINQAMLSQSVTEASLKTHAEIASGLDEFLQLTRDIQESVMMIRAQPVKSLFQRMSRIVREASVAVDKKVRLMTDGEATEIDKTVIERLADPLTHMIRNAVDHGLETPDSRIAAGKPAEGVVRLTAAHRSGRVVIEVSDDGAGINRSKVREIAVRKGLIPDEAQLSDGEIDHLLFLPGFSTADTVSNLSGRGVGMDVVKNAITSLGGRVAITSDPGKGTVFSISLPLTLAVLDGMVVGVEGETLVMPLSAITETQRLTAGKIERLGPRTNVVSVRDSFLPLLDLGVELGYREPKASYEDCIALLISQEDGSRAALVIDTIVDQRQVVIKGLQETYGRVPGVAAATILGNGQIALILDASDLIGNAVGQSRGGVDLRKAG